jgi:hypothetical protein
MHRVRNEGVRGSSPLSSTEPMSPRVVKGPLPIRDEGLCVSCGANCSRKGHHPFYKWIAYSGAQYRGQQPANGRRRLPGHRDSPEAGLHDGPAECSKPSFVGQSVPFTATVSPNLASGVPSGTVTFTVNGVATSSGPLALDALGVATLTTSNLPAGTNSITADYSGDALFVASSGSTTQTVDKTATATVLVSSLNPSSLGGSVIFTATVSPANATGTVQFTIDGAAAGVPVLLAAGQASYATSGLGVGAHVVAAT